jgi:hypothetical protein
MEISFMSLLLKSLAAFMVLGTSAVLPSANKPHPITPSPHAPAPKIQVAILLDVSNSMDGLLEQAKAQLWNMVSVLGKAKCNNVAPQIQIALYEYGRDNNPKTEGFVKQISPFTGDLDGVSKNLFSLTTNGGDEFCGHVIYTSINDLKWDTVSSNYKVIFIAGNEDFLQGDITYSKACSAAKDKGVIVNTIYCGDRQQGIREHWNLGSECGSGSFTNINPNARFEEIPTPYDSTLMVLNGKLNSTYISYGYLGQASLNQQYEMDKANTSLSPSVMAKRVEVKGKAQLYNNSSWDVVDALSKDDKAIEKLDFKTLPDSLQKKTKKEVEAIVRKKSTERTGIQKEIETVSHQRETFLVEARKKNKANTPTLETEMEKIIRQQAGRFRMVIE